MTTDADWTVSILHGEVGSVHYADRAECERLAVVALKQRGKVTDGPRPHVRRPLAVAAA